MITNKRQTRCGDTITEITCEDSGTKLKIIEYPMDHRSNDYIVINKDVNRELAIPEEVFEIIKNLFR